MDRRRRPIPLEQQLELREHAIEEVLAHPEWSAAQAIRHIKKTLGLKSADLAKLAKVGFRTVQDIEQGRTLGTVRILDKILGVVGLRLGVVRRTPTHG